MKQFQPPEQICLPQGMDWPLVLAWLAILGVVLIIGYGVWYFTKKKTAETFGHNLKEYELAATMKKLKNLENGGNGKNNKNVKIKPMEGGG